MSPHWFLGEWRSLCFHAPSFDVLCLHAFGYLSSSMSRLYAKKTSFSFRFICDFVQLFVGVALPVQCTGIRCLICRLSVTLLFLFVCLIFVVFCVCCIVGFVLFFFLFRLTFVALLFVNTFLKNRPFLCCPLFHLSRWRLMTSSSCSTNLLGSTEFHSQALLSLARP